MSNPHEAAYPIVTNGTINEEGLNKREYFAAMAMQGMIAADRTMTVPPTHISAWAVQLADALIEALNK